MADFFLSGTQLIISIVVAAAAAYLSIWLFDRTTRDIDEAGGNDINAGKDPEIVYGDFVALVSKIKSALPNTKISYISIAPNPSRWAQVEKVKLSNALVEKYCRAHKLDFINVFPLMLGPDGLPKPNIYVADRLHMNAEGYAIWKDAVSPHLR